MTTVLAFLVTIGILIVVHEYGHYKVARLCGVKVLRFSVGFGKIIWRRQASPLHTEFAVAALPLGGYVKFLDEREGPVDASEVSQAFNRQSLLKRTAIVAAGPAANLMLAVVLYAAAHWIGMSEPKALMSSPLPGSYAEQADLRSGDWVRAVSEDGSAWRDVQSMAEVSWAVMRATINAQPLHLQVTGASGQGARTVLLALDRLNAKELDAATVKKIGLGGPYSLPVLGAIRAEGAAQAAGLLEGDRVLSVDGVPVPDAAALRQRIRASAGRETVWRIERAGIAQSAIVRPREVTDGGQAFGRIDANVGGAPQMVTVQYGFWDGLRLGLQRTWDVSSMTVRMLGRILVGDASVKNLSGPLTIADVAGQSVQLGLTYFLGFLAAVSVSLGVLNLLPLPMLDGGHLMYYLFEAVTGRPVSDAWLQRLQRGGAVVLLLLMFIALSNDVTRYVGR